MPSSERPLGPAPAPAPAVLIFMALLAAAAFLAVPAPAPAREAGVPWPEGPSPVTWGCLRDSAERFGLPVPLLVLILEVESGRVGRVSKNPGGSYDMGPMQINSFWLPILAGLGLGERAVTDHGCVNLAVGAWILRSHLERTGSLARAISEYHSPNPRLGRRYLLAALSRLGRLDGAAVVRRANRGLGDRP